MARFFSRVPSVFNIVIFSIHGYFGQDEVLGMPDTGGQVVYILDQVRALEDELLRRIKQQGLLLDLTPRILVVLLCVYIYIYSFLKHIYTCSIN